MISAAAFIEQARLAGFALYTGVPCSYLQPFINYVIDSKDLRYIGAANEGDAVAIAAGAELAGQRSVVMFQNSGFGNTVNPLTSLNMIFRLPSLIITTHRGEPGGAKDEPQHALMGQITTQLFDLLQIPWETFPTEESAIGPALGRAVSSMARQRTPYGFVMKKESVAPYQLLARAERHSVPAPLATVPEWPAEPPSRTEALATVRKHTANDIVVATTGFTGRELYALGDSPNQLYMVGSMGCASSFGLGIACAKPNHRVVVLDGDGAALMRLGALATLGYERPGNLLHVLLDNEVHESTGGQSTVSHSVDLAQIARACGYPRVVRATSLEALSSVLAAPTEELTFVHLKIRPGSPANLPRPALMPMEVADRLAKWMNG